MPQALPNPTRDGNLCSCPFRVMYNDTYHLQAGGLETRDREHCGVQSLTDAKASIANLRDYVSKGGHFLPQHNGYPVLNSAWIEYEHRSRLEV